MILTVDDNEHLVIGKFAKQLKNLGLVEAFCTGFNPEGGPASHFRCRYRIDGVWHTRKIVLTAVTIYLYRFGVGEQRNLRSRISNE